MRMIKKFPKTFAYKKNLIYFYDLLTLRNLFLLPIPIDSVLNRPFI